MDIKNASKGPGIENTTQTESIPVVEDQIDEMNTIDLQNSLENNMLEENERGTTMNPTTDHLITNINSPVSSKQVINISRLEIDDEDDDIGGNLSHKVLEISESLLQVTHEKQSTEKYLKQVEKEAEELVKQLQKDIEELKTENLSLTNIIKNKDEDIISMKNLCSVENVIVKDLSKIDTQTKSCENCKLKISNLETKLNHLKNENLKILETIQPFPSVDKKLLTKVNTSEENIKKLQEEQLEENSTLSQIIQLLNEDIVNINKENVQLRNAVLELKKEIKAVADGYTYLQETKGSLPKASHFQLKLSNQFESLSQFSRIEKAT